MHAFAILNIGACMKIAYISQLDTNVISCNWITVSPNAVSARGLHTFIQENLALFDIVVTHNDQYYTYFSPVTCLLRNEALTSIAPFLAAVSVVRTKGGKQRQQGRTER